MISLTEACCHDPTRPPLGHALRSFADVKSWCGWLGYDIERVSRIIATTAG